MNIPAWINVKNEFKIYFGNYGLQIVYTFEYYYFKLNLFYEDLENYYFERF